MNPDPIPTRSELLEALKADRESFVFLQNYFEINGGPSQLIDCIADAIARIQDMLNAENARSMPEQPSKYTPIFALNECRVALESSKKCLEDNKVGYWECRSIESTLETINKALGGQP